MTTMIPDLVVGEVGFGPSWSSRPEDSELIAELRREIAALKAELADLRGQRTVLRSALGGCAALTAERATEKHEALLATDPQNDNSPQKNFLP